MVRASRSPRLTCPKAGALDLNTYVLGFKRQLELQVNYPHDL